MWPWFQSGWIMILPLAMMALCIPVCAFMRRHMFSNCRTCCGGKHNESDAEKK